MSRLFLELEDMSYLERLFYGREEDMAASFQLRSDFWQTLWVWAAVGVVFLGIAWLLYRKRDLESAGDPIAVKALVPVVQVVGAVALGGGAAMVFQEMLTGNNAVLGYIVLFGGVSVAWFALRMVLSRTSRVFQKKVILGLVPVLGVLGLTLGLTSLDIFGIESWMPDASQVQSASVNLVIGGYTEEADIRAILRLQELAIQSEDIPSTGRYDKSYLAQGLTLQEVEKKTYETEYTDEQRYVEDTFRTANILYITYDLGHGRTVERRYTIWMDGENATILKQLKPTWETFWNYNQYGVYYDRFPTELEQLSTIHISGHSNRRETISQEDVASLVEAVKADLREGHMGNDAIQEGVFRILNTDEYTGEERYIYETSLYVDLSGEVSDRWNVGVSFEVLPTSAHTLKWLEDRGYLGYEVVFPQ